MNETSSAPLSDTRDDAHLTIAKVLTANLYPLLNEASLDQLEDLLRTMPTASDEDRYRRSIVQTELDLRLTRAEKTSNTD